MHYVKNVYQYSTLIFSRLDNDVRGRDNNRRIAAIILMIHIPMVIAFTLTFFLILTIPFPFLFDPTSPIPVLSFIFMASVITVIASLTIA